MLDRVLDQVRQRLLETQPVALYRQAVRRRDHQRAPLLVHAGREALAQVSEQLSDPTRLRSSASLPSRGAGQYEQILGEPDQAVDLDDRRGDRGPHLIGCLGVAERELELGLVHCEWGAQLVTCVVDEGAFALDRGLESSEHPVEGLPSLRISSSASGSGSCARARPPKSRPLAGASPRLAAARDPRPHSPPPRRAAARPGYRAGGSCPGWRANRCGHRGMPPRPPRTCRRPSAGRASSRASSLMLRTCSRVTMNEAWSRAVSLRRRELRVRDRAEACWRRSGHPG